MNGRSGGRGGRWTGRGGWAPAYRLDQWPAVAEGVAGADSHTGYRSPDPGSRRGGLGRAARSAAQSVPGHISAANKLPPLRPHARALLQSDVTAGGVFAF